MFKAMMSYNQWLRVWSRGKSYIHKLTDYKCSYARSMSCNRNATLIAKNRMTCSNAKLQKHMHNVGIVRIKNLYAVLQMCQLSQNLVPNDRISASTIAEDLYENSCKNDKMIESLGVRKLHEHINICISIGFSDARIYSLFTRRSNLFYLKKDTFRSMLNMYASYGFTVKQIAQMLEAYDLSNVTEDNLHSFTSILRSTGMQEKDILSLISEEPSVLLINSSIILPRVDALRAIFKSTDVHELLRKSPNIMTEDWNDIREKFDYVFSSMGITQRQMMYSHMFSYPLEHIRTRHLFLVRSGNYAMPNKKKKELVKNARLQDIIDTSDADFARRFGNMTLKDYKTFDKMLQEDIEDAESDLDEEDTDSE